MSQESGFFNAQLVGNTYDRVYNAEQFAAYFASFIGNGIFGGSMEQLAVKANTPNNMTINVSPGTAWINGWWYRNDEDYNLSIAIADGVLSRIDTVVLRWGNSERNIWLQVIQGELSQNPVAPSIQRNADYYDLKLCEVNVPAGTPYIRQSLITDTRLDNNVCGLVTGVVDQIDTIELYNQFRSQFSEFMSDNETEYDSWYRTIQAQFTSWMNGEKTDFNSWFNNMKGQLSEDAAGHLQLEIDDINNWITNKKVTYLAEVGTHEGSALAKRIYGMSVQDGTPTPTSPVDIVSAKADFRCTGKNLIPYPYSDGTSRTSNGITFTVQADYGIQITGTATANAYFNLGVIPVKKGISYSLTRRNGNVISGSVANLQLYDYYGAHTNRFATTDNNDTSTHTLDIDVVLFGRVNCLKDRTYNCVVYPVFTISNDLSYEPYKHKDVTTDLTLRSIEVASTDDYNLVRDGKYYIADTIDWSEDRGYEITRRIKEITINSGDVTAPSNPRYGVVLRTAFNPNEFSVRQAVKNNLLLSAYVSSNYNDFISDSGNGLAFFDGTNLRLRHDSMASTADWSAYLQNNPVKVIGILITPTTEPITSEQAQALLSLKTYDEATTITATSDIEPTIDLEYATSEMSAKALTGHNEGYIAQELESLYGVKNLIPYPYADGASKVTNGITFTVNDDGSVTANGTATSNAYYRFNSAYNLKAGNYIGSLGIDGQDTLTYCIRYYNDTESWSHIFAGNAVSITSDKQGVLAIRIYSGVTVNNLTFKPMLRPASIQSNEYQPYAMSNYELTKEIGNSKDANNVDGDTVFLKIKNLYDSFSQALTDLKSTAIAQAVGATGSTFTSVIATLATIVNRGAVSKTLGLGESYTVPQGYHNGSGKVSVSVTSQEKTITASRSQQVVTPDSGKVLSKVTVNKYPDASGHYPVTSNGTKDMGATNNYRYVDVNVPASSSMKLVGTYSSAASVNVSSYGATSASQFIAFPSTNGSLEMSGGTGRTGSFGMGWIRGNASYTAPSLSLSGNTLSVTPATLYAYADSPAGNCSNTVNLSTSVYFIG